MERSRTERTGGAAPGSKASAPGADGEARRLRAMLDAAAVGLAEVAPDGRVLWANESLCSLLQRSRRDLLSGRLSDLLADDAGAEWQEPFARAGEAVTVEVRRGDGTTLLVHVTFAPVRDEGGEIRSYTATFDRLQSEHALFDELKRSEARLNAMLERERAARAEAERRTREEEALREATTALAQSNTTAEVVRQIANSAMVATDADGALVERIDRGTREVMIEAAAGRGTPAASSRIAYVGSIAQRVIEGATALVVSRLADVSHALPAHLVRLHPDDSAIAVPLMDGGEPVGALILLRSAEQSPFSDDVIRRARTFADLATLAFRRIHLFEESERRREELERVMDSRARLMRGFSHDVKNPRGAADGFLALLDDGIVGPIGPDQREKVQRARRSIADSLALIDDLLELTRAEAGQLDIRAMPVSIRDAVHDLVEEYRVQAEAKGLAMNVRLPAELPLVSSDATRVRQILSNLLSNAVKYTPSGRVDVAVELRNHGPDGQAPAARAAGRWIAALVSDTGPGIPADQQRLIFHEFTRLQPGEQHGAGVGLAISRMIAHALGGEITAQSEVGRGSTFTFWLPCDV